MAIGLVALAIAAQNAPVHVPGAASRPPGIYVCLERDQTFYGDYDSRDFNECVQKSRPMLEAVKSRYPTIAQNPSEPACLGKDIVTCIAWLASKMRVTTDEAGAIMGQLKLKPKEVDIYGKAEPSLQSFDVVPMPPAPAEPINVELWAPDGEHVEKVTFMLNHSPLTASTEQEWQRTAVFELATAVLGSCLGSDRLAFYRAYDAAQKNMGSSKGFDDSYSDPGVSSGIHGRLRLCNAEISTITASGVSVEMGSWSGSSMTIEPADAPSNSTPQAHGAKGRLSGHRGG